MLTMHYEPEPNFVTADLAKFFANNGASVTVITTFPNYPFGRFYDSVDSIFPHCAIESGVTVWRLPHLPYHGLSKVIRALSYLSFTLLTALLAPVLSWGPRVVIVYQTPFTLALGAIFFRLVGSKVVYINADLWPESLVAASVAPHKILLKLLFGYSRWINRFADRMITTTRGMHRRYVDDGYPAKNMAMIPLWVDGAGCELPSLSRRQPDGLFRLVYAGNLGAAQNLGVLLTALSHLQNEGVHLLTDIYGTGVEESQLRQMAESYKLLNVRFMGRVTPQEAFDACATASATLIHLTDSPLFRMTVPSKLAFSLSTGTPVVCGAPGESAELIEKSGAGLLFKPDDVASLVAALRKLSSMTRVERLVMGDAGVAFYREHFAKGQLLRSYQRLVSDLVTESNPIFVE